MIVDSTDSPVVTHEDCHDIENDPLASILLRAAYLDPTYRAAYFGPIGTVLCMTPNSDFWRRVYGELGRTRRRLKQVFTHKLVEYADDWGPGPQENASRLDQASHRRLTFTGILLIDAVSIPLHQWPTREVVGYKPRRRGGRKRRQHRGSHPAGDSAPSGT